MLVDLSAFVIPHSYSKTMMFNDLKWDWKTFGFTNPMDFALPALDWWVETGNCADTDHRVSLDG